MNHVNGGGPLATSLSVPFTQYILPYGRKERILFPATQEMADKAKLILDAGYVFEIEILRTGIISATITDPITECDVAIVLASNDETAPLKIKKMIMDFEPLPKEQRSTFVE